MRQYKKKIITCVLAFFVLFTTTIDTTYAKTVPSIYTAGMTMSVGDCITLCTENVNVKWTANQRCIKIQIAETGRVNLIALREGNAVVKAKSNGLTLKFEIKIRKHSLQRKKTAVQIYATGVDAEGNRTTKVVWSPIKGAQGYVIYQKAGDKMKRVKTTENPKRCEVFCTPGKDADGYEDNQFYVRAYLKKNGVTIYSQYSTADGIKE